jgi:hypothetical protein
LRRALASVKRVSAFWLQKRAYYGSVRVLQVRGVLFLLWCAFLAPPGLFIGAYLASRRKSLNPTKTNQIARVVPPDRAYVTQRHHLMGGVLPLAVFRIELAFIIMASLNPNLLRHGIFAGRLAHFAATRKYVSDVFVNSVPKTIAGGDVSFFQLRVGGTLPLLYSSGS